ETKQITLATKATKQGRLLNKASAWADNAATVHAEAAVVVTQAALGLKKTGPAAEFVNRQAEFTLAVANPGTAPATNVRVTDPIPAGLDFVEASDGGVYDPASHLASWTLGTLEANSERLLKIKLTAKAGGDYVNRAVVQADRGLEAVGTARLHV